MKLLRHPDPTLKIVCESVASFDASLVELIDKMIDVMYTFEGVGLAAPQVGVSKRIIIADPSAGEKASDFIVMINPTIVSGEGSSMDKEGCLSLPGVSVSVKRYADVQIAYNDVNGNALHVKLSGMAARIVQHEVDHLDGITLLDRLGRNTP